MGWYYNKSATLKSLMAELTEGYDYTRDGTRVQCECLKKCFRGAVTHSGVLWSVMKTTITKPDGCK